MRHHNDPTKCPKRKTTQAQPFAPHILHTTLMVRTAEPLSPYAAKTRERSVSTTRLIRPGLGNNARMLIDDNPKSARLASTGGHDRGVGLLALLDLGIH